MGIVAEIRPCENSMYAQNARNANLIRPSAPL
ncbi:hypothetical protein BH11MYX3_BH11MYX3_20970 [soil metagenome]